MSQSKPILSVSNLNRQVAQLLEQQVGSVWLEAEIGQFTAASSGHWYLTLKDSHAQVRCAMFKFKNRSVRQQPKPGDHVLVKANVSLYQPRGEYQLVLESLMPAGSGRLQLELEQLKAKLNAEGLFATERKQALPEQLQRLGIITSASGAALQDVLSVLARRDPSLQLIVYPSQVQGEGAEQQLVTAIEKANQRAEVELLLLTRGGGSAEDLSCFNSEKLARAIAASQLPLVSAVGHEIDVSIADLVADLRAPTPSAAAELISRDSGERQSRCKQLAKQLQQAQQLQLEQRKQWQRNLLYRLERQAPAIRLHSLQQQFDEKEFKLHAGWQKRQDRQEARLQQLWLRVQQQQPKNTIAQQQQRCQQLLQRLHQSLKLSLEQAEQNWRAQMHALSLVNPLAVLSRGYSITSITSTTSQNQQIIRSSNEVKPGMRITTKLADGELVSEVKHVIEAKSAD